jgi:hypothetical protein
MKSYRNILVAGAIAAAALATASSAGAVIVGISAPTPNPAAAGTDPLGDAFVTSLGGLSWTMGQEAFNTGALTIGDGMPMATIFRFTINNGVVNGISINPALTFFDDITTGKFWTAQFFAAGANPNQRVEFTAPQGSMISPGDQFKIRVGFVTPVSPSRYSWSASWDNTVPEPATWALMLGGFGLAGVALRRRTSAVAA